jgi:hypothetical protein
MLFLSAGICLHEERQSYAAVKESLDLDEKGTGKASCHIPIPFNCPMYFMYLSATFGTVVPSTVAISGVSLLKSSELYPSGVDRRPSEEDDG